MNRTAALEKLKTIDVDDFFKQHQKEVIKILESKDTALQMMNQIEILVKKIKELQKEDSEHKVKYFQFSYLRIGVKEHKVKIFLQAFNEKWYFDEREVDITFNLVAFEKLFQLAQRYLDAQYRKRTLKFEFFDLDNVLMDIGSHLALLGFMSFKTHLDVGNIQLKCLEGIHLSPDFEVRAGEYLGDDSILFKYSESDGEEG